MAPTNLLAQTGCSIQQVTQTVGGSGQTVLFGAHVSGDGQTIAFTSDVDLVGSNPGGSLKIYLSDTSSGSVSQVAVPGEASHLAINGDGTRIALTSTADLAPPKNLDGSREIFLLDLSTGFTQVTDTIGDGVPLLGPVGLSSSGTRLVLSSALDLVPGGNPDGNLELYFFELGFGLIQLTDTGPASSQQSPALSDDGSYIAFASDFDWTTGEDRGEPSEVFLYEIALERFTKVTSGARLSSSLSVSRAGGRVSLISSLDNLVPGANPDQRSELFLFDIRTQEIEQITSTTDFVLATVIDAAANRVVFASEGDHVPGSNPGANTELFLYDIGVGQFSQITTGGAVGAPLFGAPFSVSADGAVIAFFSHSDFALEGNYDGNAEVFLSRCSRPPLIFADGFESGDTTAWSPAE